MILVLLYLAALALVLTVAFRARGGWRHAAATQECYYCRRAIPLDVETCPHCRFATKSLDMPVSLSIYKEKT